MITILDYVASKVGEKETYNGDDHMVCRVPMFCYCACCDASLASYNAYPIRSKGLWTCRECADCRPQDTFATASDLEVYLQSLLSALEAEEKETE